MGFRLRTRRAKQQSTEISVCKENRERCSLQASLTLAVWTKGFGKVENTPRVRARENRRPGEAKVKFVLKNLGIKFLRLKSRPPNLPHKRTADRRRPYRRSAATLSVRWLQVADDVLETRRRAAKDGSSATLAARRWE